MGGLTSEVAYLRLLNDVRDVLEKEKSNSQRPLTRDEKVDFAVGIAVLLVLAIAAGYYKDVWILVEFLFLAPFLLILLYTIHRQRRQSSVSKREKVCDALDRFEESEELPVHRKQVNGTFLPATSTMVCILRDEEWISLPANIIVKGDYFRLHPGAATPAHSVEIHIAGDRIQDYKVGPVTGDSSRRNQPDVVGRSNPYLSEDETNPLASAERPAHEFMAEHIWDPPDARPGIFLSLETVAAVQVKNYLRSINEIDKSNGEANTVFGELAQIVRFRLIIIFCISFFVTLIMTVVWFVQKRGSLDPYMESELWLSSCRVWVCFSFIMPRLLFLFTDAWGTARVAAFVEWHAGSVEGPGKNGENPDPSRVPWRTLFGELADTFFQVGCGRNLLHTLNSVTVLAFCDKEGLVTDTCRSVKELAVLQAPPPESPSKNTTTPPESRKLTPIVLDILPDPRHSTGFRFEEASWAHYISSLKPLALAMAVSKQPQWNWNNGLKSGFGGPFSDQLQIYEAMNMMVSGVEVVQDCLCGASRLIGLRDSVTKTFRVRHIFLHVSKSVQQKSEKREKMLFGRGMLQWMVEDSRDESLQMFCKAPGHMVSQMCTHYFSGNKIVPLTEKDKEVLSNLMLQWISSGSLPVAYSYRPVLNPEAFRKNFALQPAEELILSDFPNPSMSESRRQFFESYNSNQILIGMAALKTGSSVEVSRYLTKVQEAGIRFCLFSPHGDKRTRTIGSQLGLETGWNCLISLEPKPVEKVLKNQMGRVVLPSGIDEIKEHVATVDNVPLLVSMFSRATPRTTREMIKILQGHGECVVLLGSALKPENFNVFHQADCSVSILVADTPLCRSCAGLVEPLEADRPDSKVSISPEIQLSADLTSLPCSLQASHSFHEGEQRTICVVVHTIKEARRCVDCIFLALVFFSCSMMEFAIMFILRILIFIPSVTNGVHLAVVISVQLPLLSLCLLWNRAHEGIMKEFPLKKADEKLHAQPDRMIILYAVRSLPTGIYLVLLFLYYHHHAWQEALANFTTRGANFTQCDGFEFSHWFLGGWIECWNSFQQEADHQAYALGPSVILNHSQSIISWCYTVYSIVFSAGFLDRGESIFRVGVWSNRLWVLICVVEFLIHTTISALILFTRGTAEPIAPEPGWIAMAAGWIPIIVALNEMVKYRDRSFHRKSQKYLRVLFSTRLGMWSPK